MKKMTLNGGPVKGHYLFKNDIIQKVCTLKRTRERERDRETLMRWTMNEK